MLKPLKTNFKGREISLECTHRREFPPPQMYGSTPDDIDNLWKQGTIDQNQYQHLKVWQEACSLMVMGPKCLDCPLALKQNPRPGRPNVIETEPWLAAKRKMHWDAMKPATVSDKNPDYAEQMTLETPSDAETPVEGIPTDDAPFAGQHDEDYPTEPPEPEPEPASIADMLGGSEDAEEEKGDSDSDLDDDIISALADD